MSIEHSAYLSFVLYTVNKCISYSCYLHTVSFDSLAFVVQCTVSIQLICLLCSILYTAQVFSIQLICLLCNILYNAKVYRIHKIVFSIKLICLLYCTLHKYSTHLSLPQSERTQVLSGFTMAVRSYNVFSKDNYAKY